MHEKKKLSLRNRIILLSIMLTFLILEIVTVFYYQNISDGLSQNFQMHTDTAAYQSASYLEDRLGLFITRIYTLVTSDAYKSMVYDFLHSDSPYQYSLTLSSFNTLFGEIRVQDSFFAGAYLSTNEGSFYDMIKYQGQDSGFTHSSIYQEYEAAGSPTIFYSYQRIDSWIYPGSKVIPVVIKTIVPGCLEDIYLIVYIDCPTLENYLSNSLASGIDSIVVNQDGNLIASGNDFKTSEYLQLIKKRNNGFPANNPDYFISSSKIGFADWTILSLTSKKVLRDSLASTRSLILVLHIISVLIVISFSFIFSGILIRPLEDLQKRMHLFSNGEYTIRSSNVGNDEVGRLSQEFNSMAEKIGELVLKLNATIDNLQTEEEKVRKEQELKQAAEIDALQAQIDPHLLYNSLNAVIWLATENKGQEIIRLVSSLSKFYEHLIRGGEKMLPIRDEVEQIRNYINIQNIRYDNSINCSFDIDESLLDEKILKLSLQPLVENSIIHGIQPKEGAHDILISIHRGSSSEHDLLIFVKDNGIGISPNKLQLMNSNLSSANIPEDGYGIYNVNKRIKMYFGEGSGLSYESVEREWTTAYLRINSSEGLN